MAQREEKPKVTPVYLRSAENVWVPALQLKTHNGKAIVAIPKITSEQDMLNCSKASKNFRYHDNQTISLDDYSNGVLPLQNVDCNGNLEDYMDMVDLPFMHEAAILYNLKYRHIRGKPYTRTGDIVIAVNPYQWYHELYTEEKRSYYSNRLVWEQSSEDPRAVMQPHVYEVSALAYKGLAFGENMNQSILVSGESGAGKTETVKICLNHIASVQRGQAPPGYFDDAKHDPVVKRVVESNPLLEAFGNAKTRRNDNSSRFGKYLQLQFQNGMQSERTFDSSARCGLVGSKCDVYLLEKNRVTTHDKEERNFHIFYQLLAASDNQKTQFWQGLRGTNNASFKYVGVTETSVIEGMKDGDRFQDTIKALALVGVEGKTLTALMQAICIVLQLGNVSFKSLRGDSDKSQVATKDELSALAQLMGVSREELELSFTERTFTTGRETHKVPLNAASAKEACDALAKSAYQKTFLWLVDIVNKATCADTTKNGQTYGTIGLLDIFGFEVFPQNRFEQLCINYANEKLQQKFTEDIFKNVQAEYKAEGISLEDIVYEDNTDVLDLIEGRSGLLNLLNEECIRPKGNDSDYVHKVLRLNKDSKALAVHRTDRLSFGIHHYAGMVMYDIDGFVSRNLDTLTTDLQECVEKCSNFIISTRRPETDIKTKKIGERWGHKQSNITAPTVWTKYKSQLSTLMGNLRQTQSRYVRCIKPNSKKMPLHMEHETTVDQLRCAGVVAGITIARSSFPNSLPNSIVLARFAHLWDTKAFPSKKKEGMDITEKRRLDCIALLEGALMSKVTSSDKGKVVKAFAVGKTKSYFRSGALEFLESCRRNGLDGPATTIQKGARGWLARHGGKNMKQLRKLEDDQRETMRLAEAEHQAKLKREAAIRHATRKQGLQELMDQITLLEKKCRKYDRKQKRMVEAAVEENRQSRRELEEMKQHFAVADEVAIRQGKIDMVEQTKMIEENNKLIAYLKHENDRARKENVKLQSKINTEIIKMKYVEDMNETYAYKIEMAERAQKAEGMVKASLKETKIKCRKLDVKVVAMQDNYMDVAKARLQLQKSVGKILSMVQERIRNRNLVEEVVVTALKAEACSKSLMAALDVASLEPDLTGSDISLDGSCSTFTDHF